MKLSVTDNDLANLILQRTGSFIALGGGPALGHWFETGEKRQLAAFLVHAGLVPAFVNAVHAEIAAEFEVLGPYLRAIDAKTFVSIGPGLGFFELMVAQENRARLLLIDIEQSTEHQHGYAKSGSGYSDLSTCRNFLVANGIEASRILTCNPLMQPLPESDVDAILSLLSMGFHYPCDEYVDFIAARLRQGGRLIFDKRAGVTDAGWERLRPYFNVVAEFPGTKSARLILARK